MRTALILSLVLFGCDKDKPKAAEPAKAPVATATPTTPATTPTTPATPPAGTVAAKPAAVALTATTSPEFEGKGTEEFELCKATSTTLTAKASTGAALSQTWTGQCAGPCSKKALAAGQKQLKEIEAGIKAGTNDEGELDYNFVECIDLSSSAMPSVEASGYAVTVVQSQKLGPHDQTQRTFQVAAVVCDKIATSDIFGETYARQWDAKNFKISSSAPGVIDVSGEAEISTGKKDYPLLTWTIDPSCAKAPVSKVHDAEAYQGE